MISLIRNASVERMEVDAYVQDEATRRVLIVEMGYFAWLRIAAAWSRPSDLAERLRFRSRTTSW